MSSVDQKSQAMLAPLGPAKPDSKTQPGSKGKSAWPTPIQLTAQPRRTLHGQWRVEARAALLRHLPIPGVCQIVEDLAGTPPVEYAPGALKAKRQDDQRGQVHQALLEQLMPSGDGISLLMEAFASLPNTVTAGKGAQPPVLPFITPEGMSPFLPGDFSRPMQVAVSVGAGKTVPGIMLGASIAGGMDHLVLLEGALPKDAKLPPQLLRELDEHTQLFSAPPSHRIWKGEATAPYPAVGMDSMVELMGCQDVDGGISLKPLPGRAELPATLLRFDIVVLQGDTLIHLSLSTRFNPVDDKLLGLNGHGSWNQHGWMVEAPDGKSAPHEWTWALPPMHLRACLRGDTRKPFDYGHPKDWKAAGEGDLITVAGHRVIRGKLIEEDNCVLVFRDGAVPSLALTAASVPGSMPQPVAQLWVRPDLGLRGFLYRISLSLEHGQRTLHRPTTTKLVELGSRPEGVTVWIGLRRLVLRGCEAWSNNGRKDYRLHLRRPETTPPLPDEVSTASDLDEHGMRKLVVFLAEHDVLIECITPWPDQGGSSETPSK